MYPDMTDYSHLPFLLVSDLQGNVFEAPPYRMTGMSLNRICLPEKGDCIPLPSGSDLFRIPGRYPIGWDPRTGEFCEVHEFEGISVEAAAAFMAPAHMQVLRSAWRTSSGAPRLPMYSYTAAGWTPEGIVAAGIRIDDDPRQDLDNFPVRKVERRARKLLRKYPANRLIGHLMNNCVLRYGCPAARNLALNRWEWPVPVSRSCNASCLACISEQPCDSCVQASQERITFTPTAEEIAEYTIPHLMHNDQAVISFGQGCEGEPLTCSDLIRDAVRLIRKKTGHGVINLNTNASRPSEVGKVLQAGVDSIRVSMNSAQPDLYESYFRPKDYGFEDVLASIETACRLKKWVSLNYFIFPGFTDTEAEFSALNSLLSSFSVDMIQTRNINIDPEWYSEVLNLKDSKTSGMRNWLNRINRLYPDVQFGYFNPAKIRVIE